MLDLILKKFCYLILGLLAYQRPLKIYNFADPLQPGSLAYIMLVGNAPLICIFF